MNRLAGVVEVVGACEVLLLAGEVEKKVEKVGIHVLGCYCSFTFFGLFCCSTDWCFFCCHVWDFPICITMLLPPVFFLDFFACDARDFLKDIELNMCLFTNRKKYVRCIVTPQHIYCASSRGPCSSQKSYFNQEYMAEYRVH
jgi:hypothetical protein